MASDTELNVKISAETADLERGMEKAKSEVDGASKSIKNDMAEIASSAKTAISTFIGFESIKNVIDTAINFDSLKMSISAATGSAQKGAEAMEFVRQVSERLGLNLESTAESYKTIAGASMGTSLEGKKARDIFLSVSEAAAVMGLSSENTKGALLALGQMISKGTVSSEELKGQLGERIPGAFQIAAQAAGVTTAELQKMLEQGMIPADEFLPKFAQAMHERFAKDVPNAAASARASMERFKNSITDLKLALAESGILEFAEMLMRGWTYMAGIISIAVKTMASSIVGAWAYIGQKWNELVVDNIVGGVDKLNSILPDSMGIDTSKLRAYASMSKETIADLKGMSTEFDKSATKTAQDLLSKIDRYNMGGGGKALSLEGDYKIGGMTPFSGEDEKGDKEEEKDKKARDEQRVQEEIQRINNQTVMLSLEGFDREEEKARQTYTKQLETVGKTSEGRIAAENLLNAQLAEIQRKRDELAGSNLMAHAEKEKQIRISQIESAKQLSMVEVQAEQDALNLKKQYADMSREEELAAIKDIEEKKYQIELAALQNKTDLYKLGSVELARNNADILMLQVKHGAQIQNIDNEIALNNKNKWSDMADSIKDSFGSAIGKLINFTTTWKNAFQGILQGILGSFTSMIGELIVKWAVKEATKFAITQGWMAATTTAAVATAATQEAALMPIKAAQATGIVTMAGLGAFASQAAIPIIGPALGAAAMATTIGTLSPLIPIASASGGFDIPAGVNPITQLHEQEMVLPKAQANAIRDMAEGGGTGGATNITIHAVDAKSVERLFKDHGSTLVKSLKVQSRNFNS